MNAFYERTPGLDTNTQYKVMRSGYAWALSMIPDAENKVLLDCACGQGYGAELMAAKAKKVIGVDISPAAIEACRAAYAGANISFERMDALKLDFPDNSFDGVVSQDTIEHVQDDGAFLAEVRRVLKPGGTFVVFTPHSPAHNLKPANPYHLREYSLDSFDKLLSGYFSGIKYYGRRLSPELTALEKELSAVRSRDFFGLRRLLPVRLRHFVAGALARAKGLSGPAEIGERDAEFLEGVGNSPTIIAVCSKSL